MVFWGLLLIAIGVGALLDVRLWPIVLIAVGAGLLLSMWSRRWGKRSTWFDMSCWCVPSSWRDPGRRNYEEPDVVSGDIR